MKKRLLKDLPFGNLNAGAVLYRVNSSYQISYGKTYYETGGSSDNGINVLDKKEKEIIDEIWEKPEWFEEANIEHIDIVASTDSITLRFKPIDKDDAETLANGIIHILPHLQDGSYTWGNFKEITTTIKNN